MLLFYILISIVFILVILAIRSGYTEFKKNIIESDIYKTIELIQKGNSYVTLGNISKGLIRAVLSIEDHRFFIHKGIDFRAIVRAIIYDIRYMKLAQGGSTITQQLCKNLFFTNKKSIKRKIAEFFAANYIEKRYSKELILELYLNIIYFGKNFYGIKKASLGYFGILPKDLGLGKSIILAGIIHGPSYYNINKKGKKEKLRQKQVIKAMIKYKNMLI